MQAKPTLLLTRPRPQSERFAALCAARIGTGARIVISPVLEIRPRGGAVDLAGIAALVLTSENAVHALSGRAGLAGLAAWCVGARTAEAARAAGMRAVSADGNADDLVAMLAARRPAGPLLHARGAETRGGVAARLSALGIETREAVVYDQVPRALDREARALLTGDAPVVLPVFSPRSAALLGEAARNAAAPLIVVALSKAVAEAWSGPAPKRLEIAERPDAGGMCDKITRFFPGSSA